MTTHESPVTTEIPLVALTGDDVIRRDPRDPDVAVEWRLTHRGVVEGLPYVDYTTREGKEGRHVFEDARAWVTVEVPVRWDRRAS